MKDATADIHQITCFFLFGAWENKEKSNQNILWISLTCTTNEIGQQNRIDLQKPIKSIR